EPLGRHTQKLGVSGNTMPYTKTEALTPLLDDIAAFVIPLNTYYYVNTYHYGPEPQGDIDSFLTAKIDSLRAFCQSLGWSELVLQMQGMTPLRGDAVERLTFIQRSVIPEA